MLKTALKVFFHLDEDAYRFGLKKPKKPRRSSTFPVFFERSAYNPAN